MRTLVFARNRENCIRSFLLLNPYVVTSELARLFFPFKSGRRKCLQVTQRMVEAGQINRFMAEEYMHYIGKKSKQWRHIREVTKFYIYMLESKEEIIYYKKEFDYPGGRADAFYIVGGKVGKKFFLEMDDGQNEFDKIQKYEKFKQSGLWKREWWADPLKSGRVSFPLILVVSEREIPGSEIVTIKTCKPGSNYLEVLTDGRIR